MGPKGMVLVKLLISSTTLNPSDLFFKAPLLWNSVTRYALIQWQSQTKEWILIGTTM